jgi:hypothetical protein
MLIISKFMESIQIFLNRSHECKNNTSFLIKNTSFTGICHLYKAYKVQFFKIVLHPNIMKKSITTLTIIFYKLQ